MSPHAQIDMEKRAHEDHHASLRLWLRLCLRNKCICRLLSVFRYWLRHRLLNIYNIFVSGSTLGFGLGFRGGCCNDTR